ncbi:calcitonin gene-related peptide type 1 receptor [Aplysia californica]|uniref:Calcitonin gene-related peptide type 1 receptor n=1 Tax=Aplysia californica TaxID=6500 RepID=A0ABM0ZX92_APLCA|nr:calcitonin gene-related peptide type 1 receptor [Aplysia californica]
MEDGTWYISPKSNKTWTNYETCVVSDDSHRLTLYLSISGYTISCVLLIISIAIFSAFRQLRCTRVLLHQHLFVSFVLTGFMWIFSNAQFMIKPEMRKDNPAWCKAMHVITQYFSVSNYFWMFCEAFFLHTIIVQAFSKQKKLLMACYFIGWVLF